ncbi:MAG: hypothetical protein EP341_09990 [Sphingomonadales bacterium]|nr:MAG: hypothetical protein EP341_09990 [Sphingomonadales bacterium]
MARRHNTILSMDQSIPNGRTSRGSKRAIWRYVALALFVILAIAWFDGGERPIRPISYEVEMAGSN